MIAAMLMKANEPLELHELSPFFKDEMDYGQVWCEVIASGICGAQIQEITGRKGHHFPRLMGHEGVVRVLKCGPGVTFVKGGDKCVAHWRKGAGIECPSPTYAMDGTGFVTGGQVTTFNTHSIISENRLTPVPEDTPDELACLLGCSTSTAMGTIENEAKLLMGETILIVGCGGLGLNLILAAKMRGASKIVVVDIHESKRDSALQAGATAFSTDLGVDWKSSFDVVVDTSGNSGAIEVAITRMAPSGRFIMVGQPESGVLLSGPIHLFAGEGKTIMATQGGRFNPAKDVPRYVAAWKSGHLKVDGIVTHKFALSEINEAIALVRAGQAGRVMIIP